MRATGPILREARPFDRVNALAIFLPDVSRTSCRRPRSQRGCVARASRSLWEELRNRSDERTAFATASALLQHYLVSAQSHTPYELIADVLSAGGLRRKLHARLGVQVSEALDELLNLALAFEANHTPSLQGFRHWLEVSEAEVKRELSDDGGGQVRIMTVHGSKGLQAPIVFLAEQRRQRHRDRRRSGRPRARCTRSARAAPACAGWCCKAKNS